MSRTGLILRSLVYYRGTGIAVVLGVATAVAVLAGALTTGDSVRSSLRRMALERIGNTHSAVSSAGYFNEALLSRSGPGAPIIAIEGVVTHDTSRRRASRVLVYGVDERFWSFHGRKMEPLAERDALVGDTLARELGAAPGDSIQVLVSKPGDIPEESLHGRRDATARTLRFLVRETLNTNRLGDFSLRAQQTAVYTVFVPLRRLQKDLGVDRRVNTVLLGDDPDPAARLRQSWQLEDAGLKLRALDEQRGFALESASTMLRAEIAKVAERAARATDAHQQPIFTYLANTIRGDGREVPYSLVAAVDLPSLPEPDSIVLNDWTARQLGVVAGDKISLDYYVWLPGGSLETRTADFTLSAVTPMTGIAADRDLAPEYPGISNTDSLSEWDPPFPLDLRRIRPVDEEYWDRYRATPKAFLRVERGQQLWSSRFGTLTSIRLSGTTMEDFRQKLLSELTLADAGFAVDPVRQQNLAASRGTTDFGGYFIAFSFFLVVAALLLIGVFFRLNVEQRMREIGTLAALGYGPARIRNLLLAEGSILTFVGAALGSAGAVGWAALILHGLRTWWVDAVGTRGIELHLTPLSIAGGAVAGALAAVIAIALSVRSAMKQTPRDLIVARPVDAVARTVGWSVLGISVGAQLLAFALIGLSFAGWMPQAGAFFAAGFLLLAAAALYFRMRITPARRRLITGLRSLGVRGVAYRPNRSAVCFVLFAAAVFLIVSLDAFRRDEKPGELPTGAGGFTLLAESALPIVYDLDSGSGRESLALTNYEAALQRVRFFGFRLRPGEDASCLNLYEPKRPRILAPSDEFVRLGRFEFQDSESESIEEKQNPWLLLNRTLAGGAIPAIMDGNTMTYVFHKSLGDEIELIEAGKLPVRLRIVGVLRDSIFQSEILVSNTSFLKLFPEQQGFRYFLADTPQDRAAEVATALEEALGDFGFDVQSTAERLAAYHRVENAYLTTFQMLGAAGLLLGTVGFGAILMRNVLERRRELALLRATGYRRVHLVAMILAENLLLLGTGVLAGAFCAFVAIAPAVVERGARLPVASMAALAGVVLAAGVLASLLAARFALRSPMLSTLRSE